MASYASGYWTELQQDSRCPDDGGFKNTLQKHLKQFNSSADSWETAVVDGPLWLAAPGNGMALLNESSSFSAVLKGRAAGWRL